MSSSKMVHPRDQISEAVVKADIWMISGAIQYGVPTTEFFAVGRESSFLATPKSASLTCPSLVINRLAPLISRWHTPCSCSHSSPMSTWCTYTHTRCSGRAPKCLTSVASEPFSTYSSTR